ncbi:calpain 5 [Thecamonas trahens ATCC 50062]|uniref:Calpain 5 n=1 Tax=Thecamonas trahens ATCC 50062 TaxID=461836 RepID=A0A0L0DA17_THETB|nr:calpain 5 [Thecamonas trahens ATCC 50062]KNC49194.1 calpain 5 [Thecamonas trahens ATCC 50062]|eukprot:XP_013758212.1 calpain 5 [Thecamonas trahens ATCC 50062]
MSDDWDDILNDFAETTDMSSVTAALEEGGKTVAAEAEALAAAQARIAAATEEAKKARPPPPSGPPPSGPRQPPPPAHRPPDGGDGGDTDAVAADDADAVRAKRLAEAKARLAKQDAERRKAAQAAVAEKIKAEEAAKPKLNLASKGAVKQSKMPKAESPAEAADTSGDPAAPEPAPLPRASLTGGPAGGDASFATSTANPAPKLTPAPLGLDAAVTPGGSSVALDGGDGASSSTDPELAGVDPAQYAHVVELSSAWDAHTAGGSFNYPQTVGNNPQFFLTVPEESGGVEVVLVLTQLERPTPQQNHSMQILVTQSGGKRISGGVYQNEVVANSGGYVNTTSVKLAVRLEGAATPYTVLVSTFMPGNEAPLKVTLCTDESEVSLEPAATVAEAGKYVHKRSLDSAWHADNSGGCMNYPTMKDNPQFFITTPKPGPPSAPKPPVAVHISLTQNLPPGSALHPIGFVVAYRNGSRITSALRKSEHIGSSGQFVNLATVDASFELECRPRPYTLVVSTFEPGCEAPFTVSVESATPLKVVQAAPASAPRVEIHNTNTEAKIVEHHSGKSFLKRTLHHPPSEPSPEFLSAEVSSAGRVYVDPTFGEPSWRRLVEQEVDSLPDGRLPACCLFDSIDPDDIVQGALGDCWLLSAISAIAGRDEAVLDLFVKDETSDAGVYGVWFWSAAGGWTEVVVDDRVPFLGERPLYACSDEKHEMWPSIVEKAYAKFQGSYAALDGGLCNDAFVNLTGGVGEFIQFKNEVGAAEALWEKLVLYHSERFLLASGSHGSDDAEENEDGIVDGHAYTILDVREIDGYRLLNIRNPHGTNEWSGDWSDHDTRHWTAARREALGHTAEDDGEFWISINDFMANYRVMYVCKVFPSDEWTETSASGVFTGAERGPADCPQYLLTNPSSEPMHVVISVRQAEVRPRNASPLYIGFEVVDHGGRPLPHLSATLNFVVPPSQFVNFLEVSWEGELPPSETPYTLIVRTYQYTGANRFLLRVFSKVAGGADAGGEGIQLKDITGDAHTASWVAASASGAASTGGAPSSGPKPWIPLAAAVKSEVAGLRQYEGGTAEAIPLALRIGQAIKAFSAALPTSETTRPEYADGPPAVAIFSQLVTFCKVASSHPDPDVLAVCDSLEALLDKICRRARG